MEAQRRYDVWAAGAAYERYMGRWSRRVAEEFGDWLDAGDGLRWLDVGCGTGGLTAVLAARCRARTVLGVDRSAGFVAYARAAPAGQAQAPVDRARASAAQARASAAQPRASSATSAAPTSPTTHFAVADALALPVRDDACDAAVSGLVLNFLPDPAAAVAEMARATRPGGLVAAYVWDYAEGMGFLRRFWDAAFETDPAAAALDEGRRFADCRPDALRAVWARAGLADVSFVPIEVPTAFADFADLWDPFLAGQGPAPGYVASLAPAARSRLRDALSARVPREPDGSVVLTARAWAVRGRRQG